MSRALAYEYFTSMVKQKDEVFEYEEVVKDIFNKVGIESTWKMVRIANNMIKNLKWTYDYTEMLRKKGHMKGINNSNYKGGNTPHGFYMDRGMQKVLFQVQDAVVNKDDDATIIIDGPTGCGKSVFGMQVCKLLDPTFNLERVCFNSKQFLDCIKKGKKGEAILFDEGFQAFTWRTGTSKSSVNLHNVLMQVRQKNLFIVICLPSAKELSKYINFEGSNLFFHIWKRQDGLRAFGAWGKYKKDQLFEVARKKGRYFRLGKNYKNLGPSWWGLFYNTWVQGVNENEYRRKKMAAFGKALNSAIAYEEGGENKKKK